MDMGKWFTLLYSKNQRNTVKPLYTNTDFKKYHCPQLPVQREKCIFTVEMSHGPFGSYDQVLASLIGPFGIVQ